MKIGSFYVLILVVVDNGLVLNEVITEGKKYPVVLILVVVDNGLVQLNADAWKQMQTSLNPCCSGQWSRTLKH